MNLIVVDRTPSSVTITWDHQITDFTYVYFIIEYSSDNWDTVQTVTTQSPIITIDGLDLFPATYKFRVRTVVYEGLDAMAPNLRREGPNSETLNGQIFDYLITSIIDLR